MEQWAVVVIAETNAHTAVCIQQIGPFSSRADASNAAYNIENKTSDMRIRTVLVQLANA